MKERTLIDMNLMRDLIVDSGIDKELMFMNEEYRNKFRDNLEKVIIKSNEDGLNGTEINTNLGTTSKESLKHWLPENSEVIDNMFKMNAWILSTLCSSSIKKANEEGLKGNKIVDDRDSYKVR